MAAQQPMIEVGAFVVFGIAMVVLTIVFASLVKALVWVLLLPVRLIFWLVGSVLVLPLFVLKAVVGSFLMLVALPVVLIAVMATVAAALLIPIVPVALLLALIWYLLRPQPGALVRS